MKPSARFFGTCILSASLSYVLADSPYWHERYHGWLSMSAYGDYQTLCPLTFTTETLAANYPDSTENPWTVLSTWGPTPVYGLEGYNVIVPEMNKVVMVFKGIYDWPNFNATPIAINTVGCGENNCTLHTGAYEAYLEAQNATDDWQVVKDAVNETGHIWSITGHGFGGMVAQIAGLDLGWRGFAQAVHTHGSPAVFNQAAADQFYSLFEGESTGRVVANNDSVPTMIPLGENYTMTLSGFYVYGTNTTYGQNWNYCTDQFDPDCLGGNNITDHEFYFTPIGMCGGTDDLTYNLTEQTSFLSSEDSAYEATATNSLPSVVSFGSSIASSIASSSSVSSSMNSSSITANSAMPSAASASPMVAAVAATSTSSSVSLSSSISSALSIALALASAYSLLH